MPGRDGARPNRRDYLKPQGTIGSIQTTAPLLEHLCWGTLAGSPTGTTLKSSRRCCLCQYFFTLSGVDTSGRHRRAQTRRLTLILLYTKVLERAILGAARKFRQRWLAKKQLTMPSAGGIPDRAALVARPNRGSGAPSRRAIRWVFLYNTIAYD